LGTSEGDVHVFRFPALVLDKTHVQNFNPQGLSKDQMALARGFSAHASPVTGLAVYEAHDVQMLFTTSV